MQWEFTTERLILKVVGEAYSEALLDFYFRNKDFLREWEPIKDEEFYSPDIQKEIIQNDIESIINGNSLKLWIIKKEEADTGRVIGMLAFSNIVWGAFLSCHLGYKMDKDELNKGYMTEAVTKGIDIMFNDYKLHRIEANIRPSNMPSMRVVEKLGFYNEGLAYNYLKINGKWEDHIHMVLLNDKV